MGSAYTPGPWKVVVPGHGHVGPWLCVQIGTDDAYVTLEVLPADAWLIAAAPDLLAVCRQAHFVLNGVQGVIGNSCEFGVRECLKQLVTVVDQAEAKLLS